MVKSWHTWAAAMAHAEATAWITGRRQRVWRGHGCLTWRVTEVGP